jgi:hypothetical protein
VLDCVDSWHFGDVVALMGVVVWLRYYVLENCFAGRFMFTDVFQQDPSTQEK